MKTRTQIRPLTARRKQDRAEMVSTVCALAEKHGISFEVIEGFLGDSRNSSVHFSCADGLALIVVFAGASPHPDCFVVPWHMEASSPRVISPGFSPWVNTVHGRKATETATGFPELVSLLRDRFQKIAAGKATVG